MHPQFVLNIYSFISSAEHERVFD